MIFNKLNKMILTLMLVITSTAVNALPITQTLILTPDTMEGNPFGLTDKPTELYAYFTFSDSLLTTNGRYRNKVTDFELNIGNTNWGFSDIQNNQFTVLNNTVTEFYLNLSYAGGNNDLGISFQGASNNYEWNAYNAYGRPTPELIGSYSIASGRVGGSSTSVPEPVTFFLILFGLALMMLFSDRKEIVNKPVFY